MRDLHDARWWLTPAQLLERIIRERAALESAVATGRPRDVWRRLRFVVDQARAWSDAGGVGLRSYLQWARLQGADNAKVTETVLPETDDDSVRILTIHGAKGLQFPITVVSGMSSPMQRPPYGPTIAFPPGQPAVSRLSARVASEGYDQWQPIDEMMDEHERLRLLYVACTRACDHLVVSLHRTTEGRLSKGTLAAALAEADAAEFAEALEPGPRPPRQASSPAPVAALPPRREWLAERDAALTAARRRLVTSATALASTAIHEADPGTGPDRAPTDLSGRDARGPRSHEPTTDPGLSKDERDAELPPWNKGRYGTAVGRAVHGVLQTVDLGTGAGLEPVARAQAMAEGVPDRTAAVTELARAALQTSVAREAASTWHGRELFVAAPLGDQLVEGYIDLVYRSPDGLVVVDWKTDTVAGDDDIDAKLARYRLQGAAYVAALEAATGEPVARMVFVFLNRAGATEAALPDLPGASGRSEGGRSPAQRLSRPQRAAGAVTDSAAEAFAEFGYQSLHGRGHALTLGLVDVADLGVEGVQNQVQRLAGQRQSLRRQLQKAAAAVAGIGHPAHQAPVAEALHGLGDPTRRLHNALGQLPGSHAVRRAGQPQRRQSRVAGSVELAGGDRLRQPRLDLAPRPQRQHQHPDCVAMPLVHVRRERTQDLVAGRSLPRLFGFSVVLSHRRHRPARPRTPADRGHRGGSDP